MPQQPPPTPYPVVDRDRLDRNLAAMAERARAGGVALRPHVKTHKCPAVAQRQRAAAPGGITVATVGEAETFADAGFDDLFLAYPVWADAAKGRRLAAVAERARLIVAVESAAAAVQLGRALPGAEALVEIDSGHHRTGVPPADAAAVGTAAERAGLRVCGVFTFPGHGYGPGRAARAAADEGAALAAAVTALRSAGLDAGVVSGGSTPTAAATDFGRLTEIRPGVYPFNDAQQIESGVAGFADVAFHVVATVVSRRGETVVVDAGSKALGADRAPWATGFGRLLDVPGARVVALSEHHATVTLPEPADGFDPAPGDQVRVVPNHVCAAVNLVDALTVVAGGEIVDEWVVAARGANG